MSFISKDHFDMALKGVRRLIDQASKNISQSDWNETDETSSAYIQNKPFKENGLEYTFVDLERAPASEQGAAILSSTCEYELIPGNIYKVIINGVEKEIECTKLSGYPGSKYLMLDPDSRWNHRVIFQQMDTSYIKSFTPYEWGTTPTSVKVIGRTQPSKRLSEQYIPNTIARISDVDEAKGKMFYGTCSTSSGTSAKTATVNDLSFVLKQGAIVYIHFTNSNSTTSSLTLNVNSTGAKPIKLANSSYYNWGAGSYMTFLYDGTYWQIISMSPGEASTNYHGITKLTNSISSTSINTAATASAVKTAYDLANKALPKSGGTMTGDLTLKGDPTLNLHAATKQYVDNSTKVDWNQNDPDAKGYVENKPFYDCRGMDEIVEEHHGVVFIELSGKYIADDIQIDYPNIFSGHDGSEFKVVLGDREFLATMQEGSLGNRSLYNSAYPDTGETFCINGSAMNFDVYSTEPINGDTVMIYRYYGGLKQLDEKFIPDTIARVSDIPTDEYITNLINNALEGIENGTY